MHLNKLSIITTTYNCIQHIENYFEQIKKLDTTKFDWIVVDAGSTDGTAQYLQSRARHFSYFVSEADSGLYYGLNKALSHVKTPYYLVFGADDRPSTTLLDDVLPLLGSSYSMILGAVRLMPTGKLKTPGPRWLHPFVWGRAISHHSVGTIIHKDVHSRHGKYDTTYSLIADGALIKKILKSTEPILKTGIVFGDYTLGGLSGRQEVRSITETFLLQVAEGSNPIMQLAFFSMRIIKGYLLSQFKKIYS
jgi:glycosyltransferase involved in cell wall biosynthesis